MYLYLLHSFYCQSEDILLKHGFRLEFKLALGQNQGVGWDVRVED